uniref:Uncharacterized protein n=1 Tax=Tanacetum cinerariifolium TaxID=118510 RepID=A0A699JRJ9_TANCI|nr:hypothetical protein [Tanacetum cinerariifolium]
MVTFPGVDLTYDVRLSCDLLLALRFRDAQTAQQSDSQRAHVLFLGPSWALPLWQPMGFSTPLCDRDGISYFHPYHDAATCGYHVMISMDDLLSFSKWNRTVVSKGEPIPDNERPLKPDQKIAEAREKKEKQALEKARAKRRGELYSVASKKKKAQRNAVFSLVWSLREDDRAKNVDVSDAHSFYFVHKEDNDEDSDDHRYISD